MAKRELTPAAAAVRSVLKKYRKEIWSPFMNAITMYELI